MHETACKLIAITSKAVENANKLVAALMEPRCGWSMSSLEEQIPLSEQVARGRSFVCEVFVGRACARCFVIITLC